jgi:hypothetical protein
MKRRLMESWLLLVYFDHLMWDGGFVRVQEELRSEPVRQVRDKEPSSASLSHAMDLACVFYVKRALCLQRSAALAVLLRRHGRPAEMVIGAQMLPFLSHAWVEVEGQVVNDKPYMTDIFQVLERC